MGWLVAVLVGAIIGALVELSMPGDLRPLGSVLAGMTGGLLGNTAMMLWGSHLGDPVSFALAALAGAPTVIGIARMLRSRPTILR
jgi:uncharacterized membrane protein YeaQ/YmgE (transglycosylase-associated protein family)